MTTSILSFFAANDSTIIYFSDCLSSLLSSYHDVIAYERLSSEDNWRAHVFCNNKYNVTEELTCSHKQLLNITRNCDTHSIAAVNLTSNVLAI